MKKVLLFLIIVIQTNLNAQVMWQVKSDTSYKWFYQDGDEFNAYVMDETKWQYGLPWCNFVLEQDLYFSNDNVVLKDGNVEFIAKHDKRKFKIKPAEINEALIKENGKTVVDGMYEAEYTAGLITSKRKYKYGYFEIRFKSNAEKGIWPAFWLYGGNPNEEIDFFELKGEKGDQIHLDVHCPIGCDNFKGGFLNLKKNWGAWIKTKESLADSWNIISGEWQPGYVKFFLNGQPIGYFEGDFKTAQNLFINTSVAKDGHAFNPGPDKTTKWPNAFIVDYVRVWSKEDTVTIKDNYQVFEHTPITIENRELYTTGLKKKVNFVYNNEKLKTEIGTITLLPILYNKYSLSVEGAKLTTLQIDVIDRFNEKVAGFALNNVQYYILDLGELPTGPYKVRISVLGQVLEQDIPVINPSKVGEQRGSK